MAQTDLCGLTQKQHKLQRLNLPLARELSFALVTQCGQLPIPALFLGRLMDRHRFLCMAPPCWPRGTPAGSMARLPQ